MTDYPDWQRAFRIVGVDVTIPINIAAAAVTLDVAIASAAVTLDINIAAAAVDLNIVFTDQSVAVFDAAKWFAHQAQGRVVIGTANVTDNSSAIIVSETVPTGKTLYITGLSFAVRDPDGPPAYMNGVLQVSSLDWINFGSYRGGTVIFDTPISFIAGTLVNFRVFQYGSGFTLLIQASYWGYYELV